MSARGLSLLFIVLAVGAPLATGCSSNARGSTATLRSEVLPPPAGFATDTTKGSGGIISIPLFEQEWGKGSARRLAFRTGYDANYLSPGTSQTISIEILRFGSKHAATSYLGNEAHDAMRSYSPTVAAFPAVKGGVAVDAHQADENGYYGHEIIMTKGDIYAALLFLSPNGGEAPTNFSALALQQYNHITSQ